MALELQDGSGLSDYCSEVIVELIPKPLRWLRAWLALFSSFPSSAAYFWSPQLQRRIDAALCKTRFDLIFVHCAFMGQYVAHRTESIRVLDYGDLDSAKWADYSRSKRFLLTLGYKLEAVKMRRYERRLAEQFDHCAVTTPGELEQFSKLDVTVPCSLIPNGVDAQYYRSDARSPAARNIAFVGRMDYFPNIDGMLYFAEQICQLFAVSYRTPSCKSLARTRVGQSWNWQRFQESPSPDMLRMSDPMSTIPWWSWRRCV